MNVTPHELNRPIVSVDFDDAVYNSGHVYHPIPEGRLFPGVRRALMLLKTNGYDVVIYTARDDKLAVWSWLHDHDLAHYVTSVTNRKPKGHVALFDNAAIRVESAANGLLGAVSGWLASRPTEPSPGVGMPNNHQTLPTGGPALDAGLPAGDREA